MCLLEPYRNAPTRTGVRISLMKLLWVQDDEQRKAKQADQPLSTILRLLASWRVRIDMGELENFADREEIMALSEAFLAWEQQTTGKGREEGREEEKLTIAHLLHQGMAIELIAQATGLSIAQIADLANRPDG